MIGVASTLHGEDSLVSYEWLEDGALIDGGEKNV